MNRHPAFPGVPGTLERQSPPAECAGGLLVSRVRRHRPVGPAGTTTTVCSGPTGTANRANCGAVVGGVRVTDVGAYTGSESPYGTFDQGGNVYEWTEQILYGGAARATRGGGWLWSAGSLAASYRNGASPTDEYDFMGFRLASVNPEPGTGLLVMAGLAGLAAQGRAPRARSARH